MPRQPGTGYSSASKGWVLPAAGHAAIQSAAERAQDLNWDKSTWNWRDGVQAHVRSVFWCYQKLENGAVSKKYKTKQNHHT